MIHHRVRKRNTGNVPDIANYKKRAAHDNRRSRSRNLKQLYNKNHCQGIREITAETPNFMSEMFGILITQGFPGKGEARYYEGMNCEGTIVIEEMEPNKSYPYPFTRCPSRSVPFARLGQDWKML